MSRRRYPRRGHSYSRSRKRPYQSRGGRYYNRSRGSRDYSRSHHRTKSRSKRSTGAWPTDAADFVTSLLDTPKEVLAALAAGVVAALGSIALALLKVALWVVIVVGVLLFAVGLVVLSAVGGAMTARWALRRAAATTETPGDTDE